MSASSLPTPKLSANVPWITFTTFASLILSTVLGKKLLYYTLSSLNTTHPIHDFSTNLDQFLPALLQDVSYIRWRFSV